MLTLSPLELQELTKHRRSDAQARTLKHMGVPFATRPDGSLAVLRVAVEARLGGGGTMARPEPQLQP
jgi:hypothetical protein